MIILIDFYKNFFDKFIKYNKLEFQKFSIKIKNDGEI